jgi:general nucleoside transport system ATP-binding protein
VPALARLTGIVKRYDEVVANDHVAFEVHAGEVHALLGENGAGKTTLMNILYGLTKPDEGVIEVDGRPVSPRRPADAIELGVGMVHQHPLLVGRLSVAENMALGGVGDGTPAGTRAALAPVTRTLPVDVDPRQRVEELPLSLRQRLEIIRCLARGVRLLILDEPTAVLTPAEVQQLFVELRRLAAEDRGVVFISHKLAEVKQIADRVTVLRVGRNVATVAAGEADANELARLMVGRPLTGVPAQARRDRGAPRLELDGCTVADHFGHRLLDGVSLTVHDGEIVCLAGVEGNGQRPLAELLFGLRRPTAGAVRLHGRPLPLIGDWRRAGIRVARIPEDRRHDGLVLEAPLWRNLLSGPMAPAQPLLQPRRRALLGWAQEVLAEYGVTPNNPQTTTATLSGGNQQKLVLARELAGHPEVLVAVNPTRGLDVGAQLDIYRRLQQLAQAGMAVLLISTDLDEVERLADQIGVLDRGRLHGPFPREETSRDRLGRLMTGLEPWSVTTGPGAGP